MTGPPVPGDVLVWVDPISKTGYLSVYIVVDCLSGGNQHLIRVVSAAGWVAVAATSAFFPYTNVRLPAGSDGEQHKNSL